MAVSPFPQPTVSANSFLYPAPIFINFDSTTLCQNSTKSDSVLHLLRPLRLSMMYENATRQRLDDVHSINPFMLGAIIISAPVFFLGIPALPTFQRQHYYLCGVGANSIPIPLCILAPGPSCLFLKKSKPQIEIRCFPSHLFISCVSLHSPVPPMLINRTWADMYFFLISQIAALGACRFVFS